MWMERKESFDWTITFTGRSYRRRIFELLANKSSSLVSKLSFPDSDIRSIEQVEGKEKAKIRNQQMIQKKIPFQIYSLPKGYLES